ncbi:putative membrane protein YesL [Bacillus niacini]|uniref:Membrane protein YesL n=1 Tax=Neobacillus niacini TaxID=86668 RepID=A0A852TCV9_9BACI|nr:hypothetical protein [Neobacillus niacini]NYE05829.1 putative membrane protein YesL [Neobacillus niacini]
MNKDKFFSLLDKVMDTILLSLLILTFSLPIITIVASFSAGIHVFHQKTTGVASGNLFQLFIANFKASFFKGLIAEVILCFFYLLGLLNFEIAQTTTRLTSILIYSLSIFFLMVITFSMINYMFVMTTKEEPVKEMLRKSIIMTFVKFPYSFVIGICYFIFIGSSIIFPPLIIISIGAVCYLHQKYGSKIWKSAWQPTSEAAHM